MPTPIVVQPEATDEPRRRQLNLRVSPQAGRAIREQAAREDRRPGETLEAAIWEYLERRRLPGRRRSGA